MAVQYSKSQFSEEHYLALERKSEERCEYLDGEIYLMAGESLEHGTICMNLSRIVSTQLVGKPCQAFSKDLKVRSGPTPEFGRPQKGLFSYPDLVVVCGEPRFHDAHRDVLVNPCVIIEVLSPGTEGFDRGAKWARYQEWLPELTDYLLVSQAEPRIEHYQRRAEGDWLFRGVNGLESSLTIISIDCVLPFTEVYDRLVFGLSLLDASDGPPRNP